MKAPPKTKAIEVISKKMKEVLAVRITAADREVDTKKALQKAINPAAQGIKIKSVRSTQNNRVIVEAATEEDLNVVLTSTSLEKDGLSARKKNW